MGTIGNLTTSGNVYTANQGTINNYSGNNGSVLESSGYVENATNNNSYVASSGYIGNYNGNSGSVLESSGYVENATNNSGYVGNAGYMANYSGTGTSVLENWGNLENAAVADNGVASNAGNITNYSGSGNSFLQNFSNMTNTSLTDNTTTNNYANMSNVEMFAGNNDNAAINNFQGANIDFLNMNVNSSDNTGFLTANNAGNVNYMFGHDHVDQPPVPPTSSDLITVNNFDTGTVGFGQFSTSGIGQVDINNMGAWGTLNASGNTNIWNF